MSGTGRLQTTLKDCCPLDVINEDKLIIQSSETVSSQKLHLHAHSNI